jgi:hypothetical protein
MRVAIYDRVEPPVPAHFPVRLTASCAQRAATVWLALGLPAVLAVAIASVALVLETLSAPAARAVLAQHPALGLEVLAAITFWLYLLALPIRRLFHRVAATRSVEIDADTVTVSEGGYFRRKTWSAPLGSYVGLAHHLRASLSGTRHELILVHPEKPKSVLVSIADSLPEGEVRRVAALLGQKVIPASELYRITARLQRLAQPLWRHGTTPETLVART